MSMEFDSKSYNASKESYTTQSQKIVFQKQVQNTIYNIYFSGEIGSPEHYINIINLIQSATEGDAINLHINSTGGDLASTIQIRNALLNTDATVTAIVEGECYSAATVLMLSADFIEISPHTSFMIHNYSSSAFGKGGELYERIEHLNNWFLEFFKDVYKDFLTENELQDIIKGKDIWMTTKDVQKKLENMLKKHNENLKNITDKAETKSEDNKEKTRKRKKFF